MSTPRRRKCRTCHDVRYMADWQYPCGACNPPAMEHQPRGTVWAPACACGKEFDSSRLMWAHIDGLNCAALTAWESGAPVGAGGTQ